MFRKGNFRRFLRISAIISPEEVIGEGERNNLEEQWNQRFRRGGMGRVLVAESAMNVALLNNSLADLGAMAEYGHTRQDIANAFGVPIAFLTAESNLANLQVSESQHMKLAIRPRLSRRDEKLNEQLVPRFDDRHVTAAIVAELDKFDIRVAHNGAKFDVPFLRTCLLAHAMPPLPTRKLIDPVLLARNKLRMNFNSLNAVANHLRANSKTDVEPQQWPAAALDGNRRAMSYIVKHYVQDVLVLEKVIGALKAYSGTYNTSGSGF